MNVTNTMDPTLLFLLDAEIAMMCDGLRTPAAQLRFLGRLGLHVQRKPNGKPLLARSEVERVLGAARKNYPARTNLESGPNAAGLAAFLNGRKVKRGKAA
jgi:hypothetical protein